MLSDGNMAFLSLRVYTSYRSIECKCLYIIYYVLYTNCTYERLVVGQTSQQSVHCDKQSIQPDVQPDVQSDVQPRV